MVQYNKIIKNKKKGFTLVELMVVLAITAILAVLVGGGLIAYTRLARFEKNEANARTLFQTAQISLTRMETAGELDAFRRQVMEEGDTGDHFQNDVTVTDAGGNTLVSRTKTELNQNVAALYYDRTGAAAGNHNALVERLLGDYIYDASLLNASICVEIDVQSGQVYSVFYDTKSDKLRFNQDGATNIYDRSYDHRRNDSLVGYYSAEDRVNVVQLVQTKLKVKNPRLTNGETLTLSWSGNSSLGDLDTSYTATAYDAKDTGKTKPLFTITIKRDTAGAADDNKQVITKMPVTIYTYNDAGQQTKTEKELYFPLSYNKGSFVLTLDAMADAALLRACENDEVAATSLYSITRLLNDPKDIYIAMRAEPRENYSDTYTASKEETTNEENTLLAKGGTADKAELKYFRHLYNLRWSADWKIAGEGTYTLTPQASNSTGLNWTGGGVTVYCASGERYPAAKVPSLNDPVAWPTIPELGEKIELTSKTAGVTTQTTRVPILNLQLSSKSVAKTGKAEKDELADHYVGLIGENNGKISYITLRDPDIQVNVKTETVAAGALPKADQLKLTATKFVTALAKDDENWRDVRAVGALCGVNTGTLKNCALTRGTNSSASALVAAALAFDNTTTATQRIEQTPDAGSNSYTYYTDEPRGIGGLVGVAIPKAESVMQDLTVASDVTVAGLLVDKGTQSVTNTAPDQQAEKARYAAAAAEPNDENSLWRSVGVGGVFGTVDAAQMKTDSKTNIVNNGFVTGNGFTGGIVGNLFTTGANTSTPSLTGLRNNGTVSAGANYKGDTAGDARSLVLGQFFGGIAGYGRGVTLQGCESVTRSDLTETQLKEQVKAGFDKTGALTDASPLKGDFVGGLVGYGKEIVLNGCKTGKGYVLGSRFVGGLAGGFTGSGVQQNDTNSSDVFGNRYVGGIVSVNGSNSQISGMTNTGLVAAFGQNAAYVGGIVGASYAPITGCYNTGAINGGSNNRGYVGGIVGYTENGSVQILNCYNTGSVTGATCVGGIAGKHTGGTDPTVTNCYNTGSVKGASCGALVGEYAAEIRNSYYLEGSASAATGNTKDGVNVEATAKTAAEMKETAFVLALGNEAFHQDDGRNGGYPLLAWQGGTHVVNTAAAEAIARAAEKLTVEPTLVTENCTLALASTVEGFDGTITWASSNGAVITPEGVVTLPSAGTVYVKLTATLAYGGETGTKTFLITVKSLKAQNDELVTAAKSLLDSKSTLNPVPGTDTNLCTYVENYLSRNNLDGITVTVKDPGALDYPMDVAQTTGIAADGKITYFNADPATLGIAAHFARVSGVELTLTRGESSADITAMVILNWDLDTVRDYLEKAAASVTFDTIRNQNTSEAEIISDLQLPQRTGAYPFVTFAWTSDSKLISIEGSTAGEVLTGRVTRPSVDTKVHLYPTLTFQLNESSLQAEGFRLTLPAEDLEPLRQQMQKELDENYLVTKLTYVVTGEVIDPEAVNGDIQLLTARATGIENYDDYKFIVTSGNPDVAEINAYRANIYRPMPGEAAAEVTLTVTMQHKTKDVSVQKQITLKVLPLTKAELDDALNLMEQAKAHYWDGLNDGANESQYAVTKSLHAFREAVAGENGGLTWLYDYRDAHGAGIVAGDQADYSSVGGQEQYNKFKSSNPAVIAHENLVLTQPKYNTSVTVESVLEHAVFAKYAKKITSGAWYDDYFSKLIGQKVSATMTVLGTDGPNPDGDQPPVRTTVTVVLTGVNGVGAVDRTFDTTSDKTVAEALQEGLGEDYTLTVSGYGYIGSLTGPDDFNAANAGVEFWGQYYYIDGAYDTSSPLTVPVTDGAVYGIFANEKNTTGENYGYKYNVWIHERSVTAEAETAFDVTVCQMQGNTAVPQAGVKVYADGNVMGVSDENGKVICRFEHAGDYVLTTGDELHTYSQCRVHVTEKPFKATVTVRLTGVNGIGAIDRTLEVSSSSTVAEALQQGFGEDYVLTVSEYGYIGSLTGPEDFNAANAAVAYWGQYYFVNGAYDTSSPLTVPVTAGGIYGVFANESTADSDSYYGYKYNVWFHETALTAAASETFTATVYQMGTGVAPAEGVQIFCGGELLGRTAADGTFAWHFDTAGVYVLTTGDSNHTYSQCVVTVTGKAPVCDGGANCPSRAFPDLDPAQWYHLSTDYAITNHLFIGFEDGTFRPNGQMSRAMFAMVLWRVAGSPASSAALPFADVAADAWYADAVRWAYAAGVINGVSTTAFDPESPVTREQMVTMIVRYAEKIGAVTGARDDLSQFSDGMQVSSYALAAVRWAVAVGLLRGMGNGRLEPQGTATRAEVATLLMRFASLGK